MKKLLLVLVFVASSAHGEILYTWTDTRGTAHYTNSMYEVPGRYRDRVKVLDLGLGQKTEQPASGTSGLAVQAPQQAAPPPTTILRPEATTSAGPKPGMSSRRQRATRAGGDDE